MDYPNLSAEYLTGVVTGIEVSTEYPLTRLFGGLTLDFDGNVARWDQRTVNRTQDKRFEGRHSLATPTDAQGITSKTSEMFVNFKKRTIFPEDLDGLRKVGGPSTEFDRANANVAWMLEDMKRLYHDEPWEYMIASSLLNTMSVTVSGKTVAPDFGLASTHNLTEATSWSVGTTDIDSTVETIKRVLAVDANKTPVMALCGRNIFGYLRKNSAVKSWFQNQTGSSSTFGSMQGDVLSNLFGIEWRTFRHGFFVAGTFYPYIPDDTVIFIPVPDRTWFQIHRGSVRHPSTVFGAVTDFAKTYGLASWSRLSDEPPSATAFMRWAGLAIPVFPDAYVVLDVTP